MADRRTGSPKYRGLRHRGSSFRRTGGFGLPVGARVSTGCIRIIDETRPVGLAQDQLPSDGRLRATTGWGVRSRPETGRQNGKLFLHEPLAHCCSRSFRIRVRSARVCASSRREELSPVKMPRMRGTPAPSRTCPVPEIVMLGWSDARCPDPRCWPQEGCGPRSGPRTPFGRMRCDAGPVGWKGGGGPRRGGDPPPASLPPKGLPCTGHHGSAGTPPGARSGSQGSRRLCRLAGGGSSARQNASSRPP